MTSTRPLPPRSALHAMARRHRATLRRPTTKDQLEAIRDEPDNARIIGLLKDDRKRRFADVLDLALDRVSLRADPPPHVTALREAERELEEIISERPAVEPDMRHNLQRFIAYGVGHHRRAERGDWDALMICGFANLRRSTLKAGSRPASSLSRATERMPCCGQDLARKSLMGADSKIK